jgi:hypothetical protein
MVEKSKEYGGKVLVQKHEIIEGYFAVLKDPQNNVLEYGKIKITNKNTR